MDKIGIPEEQIDHYFNIFQCTTYPIFVRLILIFNIKDSSFPTADESIRIYIKVGTLLIFNIYLQYKNLSIRERTLIAFRDEMLLKTQIRGKSQCFRLQIPKLTFNSKV